MGDLNLTIRDESSNVYKALKAKGLIFPQHSTAVMGSNLEGDKHYDQIAFPAGGTQDSYRDSGVFDFDHTPFFADAWDPEQRDYFNAAVRYHIADHRPLWAEFNI